MYCSNCGNFCQPGAKFCCVCGQALSVLPPVSAAPVANTDAASPCSETIPEAAPAPVIPEKKGSHRVPLLILLAMSLVGLVLFFLFPLNPGDSNTISSPDMPWFSMVDGTLYFDESVYSGSSELTVPEQINGQAVLRLGDSCFAYTTQLTTVNLPDTLTEIGNDAFAGSFALRGIRIPDSVTQIGSGAFQDCTALEAISIPSGVEQIGSNAFRRCSSLDYVFYDGSFESWQALYDAKINPNTTVHCTDGDYPLG